LSDYGATFHLPRQPDDQKSSRRQVLLLELLDWSVKRNGQHRSKHSSI